MRYSFMAAGLLSGLIVTGLFVFHHPSAATAAEAGPASAQATQNAAQAPTARDGSPTRPLAGIPADRLGAWTDDLAARAHLLPPGLEADVLLRLAAALPGGDTVRIDRLLDRAAIAAAHAQRRLPGLATLAYVNDETSDPLHRPFTAGLDTTHLMLRNAHQRGLQGAALADAWRALPLPEATTCTAHYADDPQPAFEAITAGAPPGEPLQQAWDARVAAARRETEAAAALHALTRVPEATVPRMVPALVALLDRARGDDAAFALTSLSMAGDLPLVVARLDATPELQKRLNDAYIRYVTDHLAATRCESSTKGEHWLLEQRFMAGVEGTPDADTTVPVPDAHDRDASELRKAGFAVRQALVSTDGTPPVSAAATEAAVVALLDRSETALAQADDHDAEARMPRTVLHELAPVLESMPAGALRDRAFGLVRKAITSRAIEQDDDLWWGDTLGLLRGMGSWPDGAQRLASLARDPDPRLSLYAQLAAAGLLAD
ncbi:hypothetical protein [Xanthomonas sp. NCPPB 2632]|uniref:hypothetical protein n=1 Tax=Xanthomonas sp. NCPPB 2632 TaxID=3240912 RepID=UPI003514CE09